MNVQTPSDYLLFREKSEICERDRAASLRRENLMKQRHERSYLGFSEFLAGSRCPSVTAIITLPWEPKEDLGYNV